MKHEPAYTTWQNAGREFARKMRESRRSVVPLGEEAYQYAHSRGLPHTNTIVRAFREGYTLEMQSC